jgi:hypothetical protein
MPTLPIGAVFAGTATIRGRTVSIFWDPATGCWYFHSPMSNTFQRVQEGSLIDELNYRFAGFIEQYKSLGLTGGYDMPPEFSAWLAPRPDSSPDLDIQDRRPGVSIGDVAYDFRDIGSEWQYAQLTFTLPQAAAHNFRGFDTIPYALDLDRCNADFNGDGSITITYVAEGPTAGNDVLGAAMVQGVTQVTGVQMQQGVIVDVELDLSLSAAFIDANGHPALLVPIYETRSGP